MPPPTVAVGAATTMPQRHQIREATCIAAGRRRARSKGQREEGALGLVGLDSCCSWGVEGGFGLASPTTRHGLVGAQSLAHFPLLSLNKPLPNGRCQTDPATPCAAGLPPRAPPAFAPSRAARTRDADGRAHEAGGRVHDLQDGRRLGHLERQLDGLGRARASVWFGGGGARGRKLCKVRGAHAQRGPSLARQPTEPGAALLASRRSAAAASANAAAARPPSV
jgi:hypothetical protein